MQNSDKPMSGFTRREFLRGLAATAAASLAGSIATGAVLSEKDDRFVRPAMYWKPLDGGRVECNLCPRKCGVEKGDRGQCGVRENRGGIYYTLVFGRVVSQHIDPIEKKPLFHFKPGSRVYSMATAGCNLKCDFCQNWAISQSRPEEVAAVRLAPERVVTEARAGDAPVIAFTYSEPIVFYEYALATARAAKKAGLDAIMISNGSINPEPLRRLAPELGAYKVDLKAFTEDYYRKICKSRLAPVLETLKLLAKLKVWTEIVVLIVPTLNDSDHEIRSMCKWVHNELGPDVPIHFSKFWPTYKLQTLPSTPASTLNRARRIALDEGLNYAYIGNIPGHEGENTWCPQCKTKLIHRVSFAVVKNLVKDGRCPNCSRAIPGVW